MVDIFQDILQEASLRLPCGGANLDFRKEEHLALLEDIMLKRGFPQEAVSSAMKNLSDKFSYRNELTAPDIEVLKHLGLDLKSDEDYYKLRLNIFDYNSTKFVTGGGIKVFPSKTITYKRLNDFIASQKICYITYSPSINKLRSEDNVRVVEWKRSRGIGHGDFDQIIAIFKLYKAFINKVQISSKAPQGLNYEVKRVEEFNEVLNSSTAPMRLYFQHEDKLIGTNIIAASADKVLGVGKADIAFKNEVKKEVYWLSYKHGDYFGKSGQILASIPFQQYGSLQGLYDKGFVNKEFEAADDIAGEDIQRLINYFIHHVMRQANLDKYSVLNVVDVSGNVGKFYDFKTENGKTKRIDKSSPVFEILDDVEAIRKLQKYLRREGKLNVHFYTQGTEEYYFDMLSDSKVFDKDLLNTIAGKAIYGVDFFVGNTNFGRENVNLLLQSSRKLSIHQHKINMGTDNEEVDGIIIQPDEQGHLLFNPNLPTPVTLEIGKVVTLYAPILYVRYTRKEIFRWTDQRGKNIIISGRFMILPKGKKTGRSIEIKM